MTIFNTYYAISGYTNAARYTSRLIDMFHNAGILMIELGKNIEKRVGLQKPRNSLKEQLLS